MNRGYAPGPWGAFEKLSSDRGRQRFREVLGELRRWRATPLLVSPPHTSEASAVEMAGHRVVKRRFRSPEWPAAARPRLPLSLHHPDLAARRFGLLHPTSRTSRREPVR